MKPADNSDAELLVYADWLLDHGMDESSDDVRYGVVSIKTNQWCYESRYSVAGGFGVAVGVAGGVGGVVGGFGVGGGVI